MVTKELKTILINSSGQFEEIPNFYPILKAQLKDNCKPGDMYEVGINHTPFCSSIDGEKCDCEPEVDVRQLR